MNNVTATTSSTTPTAPTTTKKDNTTLGKDDFLKLLVGQMRNMDPMSPAGDKEFIQQMTSFSMLEQISNMAATNEKLAAGTQTSQVLGLIGKTVTYIGTDGQSATGVVQQVDMTTSGPKLTIDGVADITPDAISTVR